VLGLDLVLASWAGQWYFMRGRQTASLGLVQITPQRRIPCSMMIEPMVPGYVSMKSAQHACNLLVDVLFLLPIWLPESFGNRLAW
jgi:hypothetical protein